MKIVVIGSCRFAPYQILAPVTISRIDDRQVQAFTLRKQGEQERSAKLARPIFERAIDEADEVWLYAPDGIGKHTFKDLEYALSKKKPVKQVTSIANLEALVKTKTNQTEEQKCQK